MSPRELLFFTSGLARRAPLMMVPLLAALLYNHFSGAVLPANELEIGLDSSSIFDQLPGKLLSFISMNWATMLWCGPLLLFASSVISLFCFSNLTQVLNGQDVKIADNLASAISLRNVVPFGIFQLALDIVYAAIAAVVWVSLKATYDIGGIEQAKWGLVLLLLPFPAYFGLMSAGAFASMLAPTAARRYALLREFLDRDRFARLYTFYAIRFAIEAGLSTAAALLIGKLTNSTFAIFVFTSALVILPFCFLRLSGAVLKLSLMARQPEAARLLERIRLEQSGGRASRIRLESNSTEIRNSD